MFQTPFQSRVIRIVAAFWGMHVSPAKHSFGKCDIGKCDRQTDRQTDGQTDGRRTEWSLCVAMLCRRHKKYHRIPTIYKYLLCTSVCCWYPERELSSRTLPQWPGQRRRIPGPKYSPSACNVHRCLATENKEAEYYISTALNFHHQLILISP